MINLMKVDIEIEGNLLLMNDNTCYDLSRGIERVKQGLKQQCINGEISKEEYNYCNKLLGKYYYNIKY